jgi:hypothetical protein
VAETSGLLNRRTGNSRTEGSNPSVSARQHWTIRGAEDFSATLLHLRNIGLPEVRQID